VVRARRSPVPDGRAANGGPRQGTPGTPYQNRRDLQTQKPTVATGQAYGQASQQLAAQQAVPIAGANAGVPPTAQPAPGQGPMQTQAPPAPPDLYRPTERPDEPVTHGLPVGPGAGPESLQVTGAANPSMTDPVAIQLRALYQKYPSQELADLLTDIR
jgi:hypothetical protein